LIPKSKIPSFLFAATLRVHLAAAKLTKNLRIQAGFLGTALSNAPIDPSMSVCYPAGP
jgi:hypothetical protein